MMKSFLNFTALAIGVLSCETSDNPSDCSCKKNTLCTEEFRTITMHVTDDSGKPFSLDSSRTIRTSTGAVIRLGNEEVLAWARQSGNYPVLNDNSVGKIDKCGEEFVFEGFKEAKRVAYGKLTIKDNCCHVEKTAGTTEIKVKL